MGAAELAVSRTAFSEREFYLREFRGRTLALALPPQAGDPVREVVAELVAGGSRVVLLVVDRADAEAAGVREWVSHDHPRLQAELWRALGRSGCAALLLGRSRHRAAQCREQALRLGVFKLVWLDPEGGLRTAEGQRQSFVDLGLLRGWLEDGGLLRAGSQRLGLWEEVARMLEEGLPAVNVCTPEGLGEELLSYAGSGTLFTRERYTVVRGLGVDDFDAAHDLLGRGVAEGYLARRSPAEVDAVLASGFGAFVEGRDLAGIGALLVSRDGRAGEICSLYTLTRFLGGGVGEGLVAHALARARERGLTYAFAYTTSERVGAFFERNGFREVSPKEVPAEKWTDYDPDRRPKVRCYRLDL